MLRLEPALRIAAITVAAAAFAACTALGEAELSVNGADGLRDAGRDVIFIDSGTADVQVAEARAPLRCGMPLPSEQPASCGGALPDDPLACDDYSGESRVDASVEGGADVAVARDASADATGTVDAIQDAGAQSVGSDARMDGSGADVARRADAGPDGRAGARSTLDAAVPALSLRVTDAGGAVPRYSCQVQRGEDGDPVHRCERAGEGIVGAPCTASRDCAPGTACVGGANSGRCRPFCCSEESCAKQGADGGPGSYCAAQPLRDDLGAAEPLKVPVCMPGHDCRLDEPFPCDESDAGGCSCGPNTVCTVVRSDGTRACLPPGTRMAGEHCEASASTGEACAPGLFCSRTMQTCVKICQTDRDAECGSGGRCQATASFPVGFGLCVGGMALTR